MSRIGNDETLGKAISPTLHLTKDSPPTLIFFGTADRLAAMGDEFMKKSKELEHRAELFTAEGQPHGFFNRPPWQEKTTQRMDEFLSSGIGWGLRSNGDQERQFWPRSSTPMPNGSSPPGFPTAASCATDWLPSYPTASPPLLRSPGRWGPQRAIPNVRCR